MLTHITDTHRLAPSTKKMEKKGNLPKRLSVLFYLPRKEAIITPLKIIHLVVFFRLRALDKGYLTTTPASLYRQIFICPKAGAISGFYCI